MAGSIIDAMAAAVEQSAVLVVCYSEAYQNSANCRQEAQYGFKLGKPTVFVRLQYKYAADGWLGMGLINSLTLFELRTR